MGTNFPQFLLEANRVLKHGGTLFIAEVLSRFEDVKEFTNEHMPLVGFRCISLSRLKDFLYMMVFKKEAEVSSLEPDASSEFSKQLKPCLYKKR